MRPLLLHCFGVVVSARTGHTRLQDGERTSSSSSSSVSARSQFTLQRQATSSASLLRRCHGCQVVRTGYNSRCDAKQPLLHHCFGVVMAVRTGTGHNSRCDAKLLLLLLPHYVGVVVVVTIMRDLMQWAKAISSAPSLLSMLSWWYGGQAINKE